jgi:hypothetical protein
MVKDHWLTAQALALTLSQWERELESASIFRYAAIDKPAAENLPVSVCFGNNAYAYCINQRQPVPGAIIRKG